MTGISSGGGGGYDYVETYYPSGTDEGESLYHLTENKAFVFNGSEWVEQTVTDHSQLSGVNEGDHRSDSRVSDLAPVQTVNSRTGDVTGLFEADDYTPETDTHSRYTDSEARNAVETDLGEVGFQNIEDPSNTRAIGVDDSEGVLFRDNGGNTYVLWESGNVTAGNAINISGGVGAGSTPITLAVNEGAISPSNIGAADDNHGNEAHSSNFATKTTYWTDVKSYSLEGVTISGIKNDALYRETMNVDLLDGRSFSHEIDQKITTFSPGVIGNISFSGGGNEHEVRVVEVS